MSQSLSAAGHPPRPRLLPALAIVLFVAVAGLGVLALLPRRIVLDPRVISSDALYCIPVDALALAQHDIAFGDEHHVLLTRLVGDQLRPVWQSNYFAQDVAPTGALDVNGDGAEDLCMQSGDSTAAYAWALAADGREAVRVGPIHETSERPDVPWDGHVSIDDVLEHGGRRKLVCRLNAGFSRRPRGVTLVDLATGARDWTFDMGTYPKLARTADVDGDGVPDVLVTTISVDNHVARNGTDDSHCYVVSIGAGGQRKWQVEVGGVFGSAGAAVLSPVAAFAYPRVVATFCGRHARSPEPGRLFLLDGRNGRQLDRREFPLGLGVPYALGSGDAFVVGGDDGVLRVYEHGLQLVHQRSLDTEVDVWGCVDLDGDGETEIVASTPREVVVLEPDLTVRARMPVSVRATPPVVRLASAGVGHSRLAIFDGRAVLADVTTRSRVRDPVGLAVVLGLALVAGVVTPFSPGARRTGRRPSGAEAREFLLDYHQIRHETFERERPFARARLWAQAHAVGEPLPPDMLESACAEFEHIGLPTLMRYADRAARMKVDGARVRSIRFHARGVADALQVARVVPEAERAERIAEALGAIDTLAADCYEAYWEVVMRAPCRPNQAAAEAMLAKTVLLERWRIHTTYEADPGARSPVLFDRGELCALLGELVENAARSLTGQVDASLAVSITEHPTDPRLIVIRVMDNGPGIPAAARTRLFTPEVATREGGGFGLYHAREVARRWMADLTVEDAPMDRGLCVRIVVRACRVVDHEASPQPPKEART